MIYKDDTLYVDILSNEEIENIAHIKRQMFSVLSQYEVESVVLNVKGNYNKGLLNELIMDYHKNYNGKLVVDIK